MLYVLLIIDKPLLFISVITTSMISQIVISSWRIQSSTIKHILKNLTQFIVSWKPKSNVKQNLSKIQQFLYACFFCFTPKLVGPVLVNFKVFLCLTDHTMLWKFSPVSRQGHMWNKKQAAITYKLTVLNNWAFPYSNMILSSVTNERV